MWRQILNYLPVRDIQNLIYASGNEKEIVQLLAFFKCKCIDLRRKNYYLDGQKLSCMYVNEYRLDDDHPQSDMILRQCEYPTYEYTEDLIMYLSTQYKGQIASPLTCKYLRFKECPLIIILPSNYSYVKEKLYDLTVFHPLFGEICYFIKIHPQSFQVIQIVCINDLLSIPGPTF